jgi:DNA-binding NarL/FixJ family response regulator
MKDTLIKWLFLSGKQSGMGVIKVAIYEDNEGLREILCSVIRDTEGLELAGEFRHCLDILKNTAAFEPDVILMDIDLPGKSGIEGVREVKSAYPKVEVIMITVFEDDDRIFKALQAGATGYLLKKTSLHSMIQAIQEVHAGGAPMSPSIARKVLQMPFALKNDNVSEYNLSQREIEIMKLLSKGLSYKMVAEELFISIDTVRSYIKRIYEKLHVHSITEAIHKVFIEKK